LQALKIIGFTAFYGGIVKQKSQALPSFFVENFK